MTTRDHMKKEIKDRDLRFLQERQDREKEATRYKMKVVEAQSQMDVMQQNYETELSLAIDEKEKVIRTIEELYRKTLEERNAALEEVRSLKRDRDVVVKEKSDMKEYYERSVYIATLTIDRMNQEMKKCATPSHRKEVPGQSPRTSEEQFVQERRQKMAAKPYKVDNENVTQKTSENYAEILEDREENISEGEAWKDLQRVMQDVLEHRERHERLMKVYLQNQDSVQERKVWEVRKAGNDDDGGDFGEVLQQKETPHDVTEEEILAETEDSEEYSLNMEETLEIQDEVKDDKEEEDREQGNAEQELQRVVRDIQQHREHYEKLMKGNLEQRDAVLESEVWQVMKIGNDDAGDESELLQEKEMSHNVTEEDILAETEDVEEYSSNTEETVTFTRPQSSLEKLMKELNEMEEFYENFEHYLDEIRDSGELTRETVQMDEEREKRGDENPTEQYISRETEERDDDSLHELQTVEEKKENFPEVSE